MTTLPEADPTMEGPDQVYDSEALGVITAFAVRLILGLLQVSVPPLIDEPLKLGVGLQTGQDAKSPTLGEKLTAAKLTLLPLIVPA